MDTVQEQLARAQRFIESQAKLRNLMMRVMPGVANLEVVAGLEAVLEELETLAESTTPGDPLVPRRAVDERIADVTEWIARAHDLLRNVAQALSHYERAANLYTELGDKAAVSRVEDKAATFRLDAGQDVDEELKRLLTRLEKVAQGSLEEAKVLIALGEVTIQNGDNYGALEWLTRAEAILSRDPFRLPDADATLTALAESLGAIQRGEASVGTPLERAMELRLLHQRLLFALASAYRTIDPEKSEDYDSQVAALETDRSSAGAREAILESLKKLPE